jgi:hypothetical protein
VKVASETWRQWAAAVGLLTPLAPGWPFQPGGLPATSAIWAFVLSLAVLLERRRVQASQLKPAC